MDIAGCNKRLIYQGVQLLMTQEFGSTWRGGEFKTSNVVFIGRNLPERDMLEARRSAASATKPLPAID